jgi:hypothetical protein
MKRTYNIGRYMALYSMQIHLKIIILLVLVSNCKTPTYLHERFRVITCPLFKIAALRKPSKTSKWWYNSDPIEWISQSEFLLCNELAFGQCHLGLLEPRLLVCRLHRYNLGSIPPNDP